MKYVNLHTPHDFNDPWHCECTSDAYTFLISAHIQHVRL